MSLNVRPCVQCGKQVTSPAIHFGGFMPTPTGSYRKQIINDVCEVFNICADHSNARKNFEKALLAQGFKRLGSGASRTAYRKASVVVKVAYAAGKKYGPLPSDQNRIELKNSQKYPTMTPPTFVYLRSKKKPKYVNSSLGFSDYSDNGFLRVLITVY